MAGSAGEQGGRSMGIMSPELWRHLQFVRTEDVRAMMLPDMIFVKRFRQSIFAQVPLLGTIFLSESPCECVKDSLDYCRHTVSFSVQGSAIT